MNVTHEDRQNLWWLTFAPGIWAAHFVLSYGTASVWCARYSTGGDLGPTREVVGILTMVAVAAITLVGFVGWRMHTYGEPREAPPHDDDTPEDRHRFLGFATLLLASLSALATLFVGGSALFFGTCR